MNPQEEIKKIEVKIAWAEKQIAARTLRLAAIEAHKVKIDNAHVGRVAIINSQILTLEAEKDLLSTQLTDLESQIVP